MTEIPKGTPAGDAVAGMDLIHSKPEYKTNTKPVHWSGAGIEDFPKDFLEVAKADPTILAVWEGKGKIVFAWVEA